MAWSLVQGFANQSSGSNPTFSFPVAVSSGSIVVGFVFYTDSSSSNHITSIVDDKSNSYSVINFFSANPTQVYNCATFWSGSIRLTNGPKIVTVNLSVSEGNVWLSMGEFTPPNLGILNTDGATAAYQNTSNPSSGSIITRNDGDLIFCGAAIATDGTSLGSGFSTVANNGAANTVTSEFKTQTLAGSVDGNRSGTISDCVIAVAAISSVVVSQAPFNPYFRDIIPL